MTAVLAAGPALGARLRRDLLAGVVVGVIALPLSIALAVAVGVSPVAGLYTAAFAGAAATLFGGSRYNITGPTAALVPVLSHVVLAHGVAALPMVGLLAGLLLLAMSALRAGRLMRYMPGLVVVGFTAGIALSIAFGQLNTLLAVRGIDPTLEQFHARLADTIRHLGSVSATTPLLGLASLAVLVVWRRLPVLHRVPGPLVVVAGATVLAWWLGLDTPTLVSRYGAIESSMPLPSLAFLDWSLAWAVLPSAFAVAALGGIETLLSAVVADDMTTTRRRHNPNRELFGQGIANIVSPIMGGMPATAAIARTAAGIRAGGDSRLTGVAHSATVLASTLVLGPLTGQIPLTVLAAVLWSVAWNIAEAPEIVRLVRRAPREDVFILLSTIAITLFLDLTYAIGFGVLASAVLLVRRLTRVPGAQELLPDEEGRIQQVSEELSDLIQSRPDITVFTASGLLSFHCAAAFEYELTAERRGPLILRMKDVHYIDATGLLTLEEVVKHRRREGERTMLSFIQPEVRGVLDRFGLIDLVGRENVFAATRDAIESVPVVALDGP